MSWRDRLQAASFRGVAFKTHGASTEIGRRTVLHEYPGRDDAFGEDMGRRARKFSVEAIIIGLDYDNARDALIKALETPGTGELVHQYYGRRQVILVGPVRISESSDEGGIARFALDFAESGVSTEPSTRLDTPTLIDNAASNAIGVCCDDFAGKFSIDNQPGWLADHAHQIGTGMMDAIDTARAGLAGVLPDVGGATGLAQLVQSANGVRLSLTKLLRTPGDFAGNVASLIGSLSTLAPTRSDLLGYLGPTLGRSRALPTYGAGAVLAPLTGFGTNLQSIPASTPARTQQSANQQAQVDLVQRLAVIESARAIASVDFDSADQAAALRSEIADQLDSLSDTASDDVFGALADLRIAVVKDVAARGAALPTLTTTRLSATLPALVVAHRLYGDAARSDEIVLRNRLPHPGFVPGGIDLEVLSDG